MKLNTSKRKESRKVFESSELYGREELTDRRYSDNFTGVEETGCHFYRKWASHTGSIYIAGQKIQLKT